MSNSNPYKNATAAGSSRFLVDTWWNFKRGVLVSTRNPFVLTFSLFQPLIWLVLFTQVFQSLALVPGFEADSYVAFFAPAVVIMVVLFDSMSSGIGLVESMRTGTFNKLLVSPAHRGAIFFGKTLAETLRSAVEVVFVIVLAVLLGAHVEAGILGVVGIVCVAILFGLGFVALSNVVALVTQSSEATILGTQFLGLPLMFMSTAFMPPELLPEWVQTVSQFNPITYGVDATRTIMLQGWNWSVIGESVLALVVMDIVLGSIAIFLMRRATQATPR